MVKEALVVNREDLFLEGDFQGFLPSKEFDYISIILDNYYYFPRGEELEQNQKLQQIIPYVWIINSTTKEVFAYQRSAGNNYNEQRLKNKWSCGLGGHIEKEDSGDPIVQGMMRELTEEVSMENYPEPKIVGYINDDSNDVGKVHFGVVAIAEVSGKVEKGDDEMIHGKLYSVQEFEKLFHDPNNEFENWTKLSWPFVKYYLSNL